MKVMLILHPKAHTHTLFLGYVSFFVKMSISYASGTTCSIMAFNLRSFGRKGEGDWLHNFLQLYISGSQIALVLTPIKLPGNEDQNNIHDHLFI